MDLFATIKKLLPGGGALESLPPNRWDPVSYTADRTKAGQKVGTVTGHGVGLHLDTQTAWTFFQFQLTADSSVHTIWATDDIHGKQNVYFADAAMDDSQLAGGFRKTNGRIALHPIVVIAEAKISVAILFDNGDGTSTEYRFDGRSWP